jgi:hypothetical protein
VTTVALFEIVLTALDATLFAELTAFETALFDELTAFETALFDELTAFETELLAAWETELAALFAEFLILLNKLASVLFNINKHIKLKQIHLLKLKFRIIIFGVYKYEKY